MFYKQKISSRRRVVLILSVCFLGLVTFYALNDKDNKNAKPLDSQTKAKKTSDVNQEIKPTKTETVEKPLTVSTEKEAPRKKVLFGLEPYSDAEVLDVFQEYLERIKVFDESLSSQELLQFEQRMTLSVEFSEYAADVIQQELDTALIRVDPQEIYLLERVFAGGDKSPSRLVDSYMKVIESGNKEVHDYALQGIENYKEHASSKIRHLAIEEAFQQAQNYKGTDRVLPAITAIRNLTTMADISPMYKPIGINVLQDIHSATQDGRQKFYIQKTLMRLVDKNQAQNLAIQYVSTDPSKDSMLSVMEAVIMKDVELNDMLGNELTIALNRSNVSEQELLLAQEIGLLPETL